MLSSGFQSAKLEAELIASSRSFEIFWAVTAATTARVMQSKTAGRILLNILFISFGSRVSRVGLAGKIRYILRNANRGNAIAILVCSKHFCPYAVFDNSKVAVAGTLRDCAPIFATMILTGPEVTVVGKRTIRSS